MTKDELEKIIADKDEEISELKAEILMLRTEEIDDSEPISYAQQIIDDNTVEELESKLKWLNEVSEYIDVYVSYHRTVDEEEGD